MALLHVASKHLGMNVLMFIRRLGIHSGLYGSKFWLFSLSLKQYERFIAAEIFTIERKGSCRGGIVGAFHHSQSWWFTVFSVDHRMLCYIWKWSDFKTCRKTIVNHYIYIACIFLPKPYQFSGLHSWYWALYRSLCSLFICFFSLAWKFYWTKSSSTDVWYKVSC